MYVYLYTFEYFTYIWLYLHMLYYIFLLISNNYTHTFSYLCVHICVYIWFYRYTCTGHWHYVYISRHMFPCLSLNYFVTFKKIFFCLTICCSLSFACPGSTGFEPQMRIKLTTDLQAQLANHYTIIRRDLMLKRRKELSLVQGHCSKVNCNE